MVTDNMIFVFGSNLAGIHGAGADKWAKYARGAKQGVGVGLCGQSYAIPTKDHELKPLSLGIIYGYIKDFKEYAITHPKKTIPGYSSWLWSGKEFKTGNCSTFLQLTKKLFL